MNRIGEVVNGVKIIAYRNAKDIDVQFEDGSVSENITYDNFKFGRVKNKNMPISKGVGYIGYGKYNSKSNLKEYTVWTGLL